MMGAAEIDPLFVKALGFLHSNHPDSTRQLQNLVQNYREKVYGSSNTLKVDATERKIKSESIKAKASKASVSAIVVNPNHKAEVSVSTVLDEVHSPSVKASKVSPPGERPQNPTDAVTSVAKDTIHSTEEVLSCSLTDLRVKVEKKCESEQTIEEVISGSSFEPPLKKQRTDSGSTDPNTSQSDDSIDVIPLTDIMDMDFDGLICVMCSRSLSGPENEIIECHECNKQYHQQCHKPPVSTKDVNDPRLIWYCFKCTKKQKKEMAAQQLSVTTKSKEQSPAKKVVTNPFHQSKMASTVQPFRRSSNEVSRLAGIGKSKFSSEQSSRSTKAKTSEPEPSDPNTMDSGSKVVIDEKAFKQAELGRKRAKILQKLKSKK